MTSCGILDELLGQNSSGGKEETEETEHEHTFGDKWTSDAAGHWYAATCEHKDITSLYGTHLWNGGVVTSEPDAENDGIMTYTCVVCGFETTEAIEYLAPSHEHIYGGILSSDATGHWYAAICEHTDMAIEYSTHNFDGGTVTTQPTMDTEGIKTYVCTDCSYEKRESIGKLRESYTVTFEGEGIEPYSITVKHGAEFAFPVVKSGTDNNVIVGWVDKETGERVSSNVFNYITDKTFVAVWGKEWSDNF